MNYYDNEKNVEVTSDPSDGFMMTSKGEVSLYYTWNENIADLDKNTTLNGVLTIDPKEYGTIFSSETHPLEIMIESSGNYTSTMKINLNPRTPTTQMVKENTTFRSLQYGLKTKSSYRIPHGATLRIR